MFIWLIFFNYNVLWQFLYPQVFIYIWTIILNAYLYPEIPPVFITTPWNPWFCWIFAKIALLYFITTKSLAHPKNIEFIGFLVVVIIFSEILGDMYLHQKICLMHQLYIQNYTPITHKYPYISRKISKTFDFMRFPDSSDTLH